MESAVKQAIRPIKTRHDVEILDAYVRPAFADTVEHRHDDEAAALCVDIHPNIAVVGACDRTYPRVGLIYQIVIALRERGFPVAYLVAPDEGHGFAGPENNMAMFAAAEKFLAKYLGGRYQVAMTWKVAQRLKKITVDVNTVALPNKMDATAGKPKPSID